MKISIPVREGGLRAFVAANSFARQKWSTYFIASPLRKTIKQMEASQDELASPIVVDDLTEETMKQLWTKLTAESSQEDIQQVAQEVSSYIYRVQDSQSRRVLAAAYDEARRLGVENIVDVEHLLLALIRERKGLAGRVFAEMGVEIEQARQILKIIN